MSNKILLPQLVTLLSSASGASKKNAEIFVKSFFATLADVLKRHESVKIKGLGTFKIIRIEERKSVNVSTGSDMQIPAHFKVVFNPAQSLADKVNSEFAWLDVVELTNNVTNEELDSVKNPEDGLISELSVPDSISNFKSDLIEDSEEEYTEEPDKITPEEIKADIDNKETELEELIEINPQENDHLGDSLEEEFSETSQSEDDLSPESDMPVMEKKALKIRTEISNDIQHQKERTDISSGSIIIKSLLKKKNTAEDDGKTPIVRATFMPGLQITREEEKESEKLGEELERDFGQIEPVEPFGPVDPPDPEPGEPIPENVSAVPMMEDFDPYSSASGTNPPTHSNGHYYISKDEYSNLATKSEIRILSKNLRKLKANLDRTNDKHTKSARNILFWSLLLCLLLMTGGFFLFCYLYTGSFTPPSFQNTQQSETSTRKVQVNDDEYAPTTVAGFEDQMLINDSSGTNFPSDGKVIEISEPDEKSSSVTSANLSSPSTETIDEISSSRFLTTMAKEYYGNYDFWPYIYLENKDRLGHPDHIKPGTKIVIPNIAKYDVDPSNPNDLDKAKKLGVDIYRKYSN